MIIKLYNEGRIYFENNIFTCISEIGKLLKLPRISIQNITTLYLKEGRLYIKKCESTLKELYILVEKEFNIKVSTQNSFKNHLKSFIILLKW